MNSFFSEYCSILYKIKTIHANRIYSGDKSYELRKAIPQNKPKIIFLYENEDQKAITGGFFVKQIIIQPIEELWKIVGESGTTKKRFFNYYSGCLLGCAYEIDFSFKFINPLMTEDIKTLEKKFHYPQSFIYLSKHKLLHIKLLQLLEEEYQKKLNIICFNKPSTSEEDLFRKMTKPIISKNYDEIDDTFIDNIISCTHLGFDPNGFFTSKKTLHSVKFNSELIGFTVVTEKIGNSIKTGPTILLKKYRKKGFGRLIRNKIAYEYYLKGFRKLYCTCSAYDKDTLHYLLKSGLRVEAHLVNQYKKGSSEFVLGKLFAQHKKRFPDIIRDQSKISRIIRTSNKSIFEIKDFLLVYFEKYFTKIDEKFCDSLINASKDSRHKNYSQKGKIIFRFYNKKNIIVGMVICSPKRGGSVKLTPIFLTENHESIYKVFLRIESYFRTKKRSKLYLNLLVNDIALIGFCNRLGYIIEGLLQEPYQDGVDMVQMGKEI